MNSLHIFLRNYFCYALIFHVLPLINCANKSGNYASSKWSDQKNYGNCACQKRKSVRSISMTNTKIGYFNDSIRCGLILEAEKEKPEKEKHILRAKRFRAEGDGRVNKIMGGQNVREGTSPWTVAIFPVYVCSGTLISKRHVATAAHCLFDGSANKICFGSEFKNANEQKAEEMCRQPKGFLSVEQIRQQITVYIGSVCLSGHSDPPCESPKTQKQFRVKNAIETAFCKKKCASDDFAVLELELDSEMEEAVPAQLANHIVREKRPPSKCLPFMHNFRDDFYWSSTGQTLPVQITGWGSSPDKQRHGQYGKAYSKLQMLEMPNIWRHNVCRQKREELMEQDGIGFSEDKLCTMEMKNRDTCLGDSGGGLVGNFEDGKGRRRWFLLGVLSAGGDCLQLSAGSLPPLIQEFTNLTFHKNVIAKFVNADESAPTATALAAGQQTMATKTDEQLQHEIESDMWGHCQ